MGRKSLLAVLVLALAGISAVAINDALAQQAAAEPQAVRVGICDVVHLIRNYRRVNDLNAELDRRRLALETEERQRLTQLERLQAELETLADTSPEYQRTLETLLTRQVEAKAWKEAQEALLLQWHFVTTRGMFEEALAAIEEVAREQGLTMVLVKEPEKFQAPTSPDLVQEFIARRKVLWADPSLDITATVLARMNMRYRPPGS